ncbi:MAG: phosphoribosylformylglycinamidine cyclo-ligase, partial [Lachnospiraceae bacterium]|nr:phosphoribosylformylglycinamidine cyclo-ligase [Lachnospiraceae bacterium]
DVLVGIASSGVHSNGFSLVRKVFQMTTDNLIRYNNELGMSLGDALLTPTRIYVKALKAVQDAGVVIKGCSHITGGGFYENIPRMFPEGIGAKVQKNSYEVPTIFKLLQSAGEIEEQMMYNTYNMGVGMMLAVDPTQADAAVKALNAAGEKAFIVGETVSGEKSVTIC